MIKIVKQKKYLPLILFFLLLLLTTLIGCTTKQSPVTEPAVHLVWPAAPEEARIEWVKEYKILEDTASRTGFWGKISDFFLGPKMAQITRPYGVCTDNGKRLFVADTGGAVIHVFDMEKSSYLAIEGSDEVPLQSPIGLTYVDGFLYITDSVQGIILQYDLEKKILHPWSSYQLGRPTGIAFSAVSGLFYVTDTAAHEIVVLDRSGVEKFRFGGRGTAAGELNFPTDLWVDQQGKVYVTDALNARIQIFSATGEFLSSFGKPGDTPGSFSKPKGVAVSQHGYIYVCDALFDAVQIFDAAGQLLLSFGHSGPEPGQFWMPSGIFIDQQAYIYVADTYNRRIQVFRELSQ